MATISDTANKTTDAWDNFRHPAADDPAMKAGPVLTRMADVEAREIDWLWPGRIPLGRITLLVGRPGEGKSFLTTDMAARISTGTPWPDGSHCPAGSVIIISAEDDPGDTIRPRLDAHHADCTKIHLLSAVRRLDEKGKLREVMFGLGDVMALDQTLQAVPDCRMIVVDPIGSYLGGSTDAHRDNEVRSVLAPVAQLAEKYGCAVLVVAHRRKSAGANADEMALGSRAFTGIARAVWHLCRQSDVDGGAKDAEQMTGAKSPVRLLLPGKMNLCQQPDGLAFTIGGDPARLIWSRDPVKMSADDGLAAEYAATAGDERPGPEPEARNAAKEWLTKLLVGGFVEAAKVKSEAADAGLNYRTVQRAADAMGVMREKNTFTGGWQWRLATPKSEGDRLDDTPPKEKELVHLSPSRNSPENAVPKVTPPEGDKLIYPVALGDAEPQIGLPDAQQYSPETVANLFTAGDEKAGVI